MSARSRAYPWWGPRKKPADGWLVALVDRADLVRAVWGWLDKPERPWWATSEAFEWLAETDRLYAHGFMRGGLDE